MRLDYYRLKHVDLPGIDCNNEDAIQYCASSCCHARLPCWQKTIFGAAWVGWFIIRFIIHAAKSTGVLYVCRALSHLAAGSGICIRNTKYLWAGLLPQTSHHILHRTISHLYSSGRWTGEVTTCHRFCDPPSLRQRQGLQVSETRAPRSQTRWPPSD